MRDTTANHLKIVYDEKIPVVSDLFSAWGELIAIKGQRINRPHLTNADILLTRTVTAVNRELLHDSKLKAVASATSGMDHIDKPYLNQHNIAYFDAKGANALAVRDYVLACLQYLYNKNLLKKSTLRVGVIGVGQVGRLVVDLFKRLGHEVLVYDPPKAAIEQDFSSESLEALVNLDVISVHCELTQSGNHPSYHMLGQQFLQQQSAGAILINAARGDVFENQTLLRYGKQLHWCFDVWPNEPQLDRDVVKHCTIATPHIAGYSEAAKIRATWLIHQQLAAYFSLPLATKPLLPKVNCKQVDNLIDFDALTKQLQRAPSEFITLRRAYNLRAEMVF